MEVNMEVNMEKELYAVYEAIDALVDYAEARLELAELDTDWVRNQIFALFALNSYPSAGISNAARKVSEIAPERPDTLLAAFTEACIAANLFAQEEADSRCDQVMGILTRTPSQISARFSDISQSSGTQAMEWFYNYCVANNYVRRSVLDRNPRFNANGLIITINKAKPEFKDPKKAAAGNSVSGGYPKCSICHENEGFAGRTKYTLRTVPLQLAGEKWFWQFSPYGYLACHGIAINSQHTPMHVDRKTFTKLMDFVDQYPDFFIGCNAALARIGGSVLGHDHYQAGGEALPMQRAGAWKTLQDQNFPDAIVEILDWHNTAIRVVSKNRNAIEEISDKIRQAWVVYNNPDFGIKSGNGSEHFSAVSPTVIRTERGYEMSLILRSNITSAEFPEGVFHAHPEYFPIKQESIGLIEAQGLFVLPGRLDWQLAQIADALAAGTELPADLSEFELVWNELREMLGDETDRSAAESAIRKELGSICERILENTAVFKDKETTVEFLSSIGIEA
ncbi:galactose-1-phosphate uridylyltransferase [Arcanobacterium hippocoleae]